MSRWISAAVLTIAAAMAVTGWESAAAAQQVPGFAGRWTLNRALSQFPREVGFGVAIPPGLASGDREGGAPVAYVPRNESETEARNTRELVDEVRTPSPHLTIVQSDTAISITDDQGRSRRFRPDGKDEFQPFGAAPVATMARWEGAFFVVRFKVAKDREVRFTYSRKLDPPQLIVQTQFVERGDRDVITRVYEPTQADEPSTPSGAVPASPAQPGGNPAGAKPVPPSDLRGASRAYDPNRPVLPPATADPAKPDMPAVAGVTQAPLGAIKPDAELKGITRLGLVVEGFDQSAETCGLKQDAVEAMLSKSLSDAGLKVARNADEDTYLYVNINATKMTTGFCVSRYDAILYSYTTAKLSYSDTPLLVQVSLLRNGGVSGGAPGPHAEGVIKALKQYVDQFAARIRNANR